jgi:hypothetical protein
LWWLLLNVDDATEFVVYVEAIVEMEVVEDEEAAECFLLALPNAKEKGFFFNVPVAAFGVPAPEEEVPAMAVELVVGVLIVGANEELLEAEEAKAADETVVTISPAGVGVVEGMGV